MAILLTLSTIFSAGCRENENNKKVSPQYEEIEKDYLACSEKATSNVLQKKGYTDPGNFIDNRYDQMRALCPDVHDEFYKLPDDQHLEIFKKADEKNQELIEKYLKDNYDPNKGQKIIGDYVKCTENATRHVLKTTQSDDEQFDTKKDKEIDKICSDAKGKYWLLPHEQKLEIIGKAQEAEERVIQEHNEKNNPKEKKNHPLHPMMKERT